MERSAAIQAIREHWREIITHYTEPAKKKVAGKQTYICPFCGHGKGGDGIAGNPKSRDGNGIKCFGCEFSGDILDFIQKCSGVSSKEALETAAAYIGVTIDEPHARPHTRPQGAHKRTEEETPMDHAKSPQRGIQELTDAYIEDNSRYYGECIERLDDPAAISYLQARGISQETAAAYFVGYDPAWISPTVIKNQQAKGSSWRPDPTKRIIIPVSKSHYIARAINPNIKEYAKMNETGGGSIDIFNMRAVQENHYVFIVEGVFDALSIIEAGGAAIALNSASNADIFIKRLEQTPTAATFIICLDNDTAGRKAAGVIEEGLTRLTIDHITTDIAGGHKDANEALTADREAFAAAIRDAQRQARQQGDYITDFLETVQTEAYKPYKTGLSFFDDLLCGGVMRQTLLLLLAAPGTGKTTLAQQIAERMAAHKKPVVYFNLEMSREQMIAKTISGRLARKNIRKTALDILQGYQWTEADRVAILAAAEEYRQEIQPYLSYNPGNVGNDIDDIKKYLNRIGERARTSGKEAPVVIMDYLHLISSRNRLETQELIKQAIMTLKEYAINYNTFVIAISATNRTSNATGRITMESGRDSSSLEYTGDYLLSLNYYEVDKGDVDPEKAAQIGELLQRSCRRMILRVLKGRMITPGKTANVHFYAPGNIFFSENDFIPVEENEMIPFDENPHSPGTKAAEGKPTNKMRI